MNTKKNLNIAKTMRETYARRKSQNCRTFKFKVDKSRLTSQQKEQLKMMLIESKWIYNYIIGNCDPYNVSDKEELEEQTKLVNSFLKLAYWY